MFQFILLQAKGEDSVKVRCDDSRICLHLAPPRHPPGFSSRPSNGFLMRWLMMSWLSESR